MRLVFLIIFFTSIFFIAQAQLPAIGQSFHHKPTICVDLTGYTSFIKKDWATFTGFRSGLNFNDITKVGVGISHLSSPVVMPISITENDTKYTTNGILKLTYGEIFFEYLFYKDESWRLSIPLVAGLGNAHYTYISRSSFTRSKSAGNTVWLLKPEISAQYKIINWIGAVSSIGYLYGINSLPYLDQHLSSFTFSIGFKLILDDIADRLLTSEKQ